MKNHISELKEIISPFREEIIHHKVYSEIKNISNNIEQDIENI